MHLSVSSPGSQEQDQRGLRPWRTWLFFLNFPEDQPGLLLAVTAQGTDPALGVHLRQLFQERFSSQGRLRPRKLGQGMEPACLVMGRAGQGCQDLAGLSLFF